MPVSYSDLSQGTAVSYDGHSRNSLKGLHGKVAAYNYNSALVDFEKNGKLHSSEWVGFSALNLVKETPLVTELRKRKEALEAEVAEINKALEALSNIKL